MTWPSNSTRKVELPPDWDHIRRLVLKRDGHRCTWLIDGRRCAAPATDVDHIDNPHDHTMTNLRSLCEPHHDRRTALQGVGARAQRRALGHRPPPPHPGIRGGGG